MEKIAPSGISGRREGCQFGQIPSEIFVDQKVVDKRVSQIPSEISVDQRVQRVGQIPSEISVATSVDQLARSLRDSMGDERSARPETPFQELLYVKFGGCLWVKKFWSRFSVLRKACPVLRKASSFNARRATSKALKVLLRRVDACSLTWFLKCCRELPDWKLATFLVLQGFWKEARKLATFLVLQS